MTKYWQTGLEQIEIVVRGIPIGEWSDSFKILHVSTGGQILSKSDVFQKIET